ncbi:MAG TPA: type VI secretion system membrane subunit TssM [Caulobacteraceae bacterium]|nr:type VI secretion system membrane subunit TssM [Caulobacteraceae bacterium]
MRRIFNFWTVTLLAAVLVALLLALGLPLFILPLRPWWVRLLMVLGVALIWGIFALIHVLTAKRHSDAIADEIAQAPPSPGDEEARALGQRMAEALTALKKASGDKRDYLYSRPWYVIIGPPGAGKTTALLNSGLRFPFADSALKGVGGTRNLDFWFADEAALVDTAGRYTTQDSDAATDAKAWESFLGLLRKHRPLQPINGVLVAIGIDELLRCDLQRLDAHASAVRRRLAELRRTLELAAPVYVLFTKADLMAGFVEFYDDLDVEGRRAVLGATLPWGRPVAAEALAGEFDQLVQAVADRASKRLQEEHDVRRRGLIMGFTPQIEGLRSRALRFLEGAFLADRGPTEPLRGFYFTSGVQEGAPLDRLLSDVAQVFEAPRTGREAQGRAYFLNRLLGDVVFPEAGLAQAEAGAKARRAAQLTGAVIGIAAVAVLVVGLWTVSFLGNRNFQQGVLTGTQTAQQALHDSGADLIEVRDSDTDLDQTLPFLNALRTLPQGYDWQLKHGAPFFQTFGLYQHDLARQEKQTYLQSVQRVLMPRLLLRLEAYLRQNVNQPFQEYEPLRVYLMLGGQGPMDAKAVKTWIENDWAANVYPGDDRSETRKELGDHLDAMLSDPDLGSVWSSHAAPLDGNLIAQARAAVQTLSLADRAYAILKEKGATAGAPWQASTVLASGDALAFANGPAVLQLQVPYFFTRDGYEKTYLIGLGTVAEDLKSQLWVLGPDADTTAIRSQVEGVRPGVAASYARDYIAAWTNVAKALQPADYFHNPAALGAFTRTPSPLKLVLLELAKNVTFTGGASGAAGTLVKQQLMQNTIVSQVASAAGSSPQGPQQVDAAQQIHLNFQPLLAYIGDGKTPAPIDDFINAIKSAASANTAAVTASAMGGLGGGASANQSQLATALGAVGTAGAGAPPELQSFVSQATKGGTQAATSTAQTAVATSYTQSLATPCQTLVSNHYPFIAAAPADAPVADLIRVFGMNGQMDSFARDQLTALLDASGPVWRWRTDNPVAASLDPVSAEQFHRASEIRDLLTSGEPMQIEPAGLGASVASADFSAGGVVYKFDPTTTGARQLIWSVNGLPEAHVTLYGKTGPLQQVSFTGPFALFRLMDAAKKQNTGPTSFQATFGQGAATASFRITLPTDQNPFSRGGPWSFRCPSAL